jgi:O-antigen biosynthesis protein WbqP
LTKRVFDFSVALVILVLASPVMLIVAIAIAVTSKGPVIFSQTRVGRNRAEFQCLKFRTMAAGTPDVSSHQASANWITPVGRFLRRTKLDELPQLWNVLWGEMSLVGPRPCLPGQTELVAARSARGVFDVLPGITGRAQLEGVDMSQPERLSTIDQQYIATRTFRGDLSILVRTALGKGSGDAARV